MDKLTIEKKIKNVGTMTIILETYDTTDTDEKRQACLQAVRDAFPAEVIGEVPIPQANTVTNRMLKQIFNFIMSTNEARENKDRIRLPFVIKLPNSPGVGYCSAQGVHRIIDELLPGEGMVIVYDPPKSNSCAPLPAKTETDR